ncbi:hypothetical protein [Azospirillum halopraeferens]|uniref:hypothetical protein n=1 Tax=Azospirillum halopraeferens TaxID=34010 RepID=UPI000412474E|nr:hypothetical protein [Azospirillum halopraeferens]
MPQDFRSLRDAAQTIGFHELRQACEISTLRQDLERAQRQADALRGHIDATVEQVRARVASLTTADLADAATMAPLLQYAVSQLIGIRDAARRPESVPAAGAAPITGDPAAPPSPAADPFAPPPPPPPAMAPPPVPPLTAAPAAPVVPAPSWLLPPGETRPPRPALTARPAANTPGSIDWLKPARR